MTTPLAPFGRTLAFAEQTLSAVLVKHLAARQTAPETWFALQSVDLHGPRAPRDQLSRQLERSRTLDPDSVRDLLARLDAEGLIRGEDEIDFTTEGEALFHDLRAYVTAPAARLLSQFDPEDIATTIRTLQAVTARAAEELAAAD